MHVLIVKPSSIGDVLHTFPAVAWLRAALKGATISWVVNEELAGVVRLCPGIDRIVPFPRRRAANPVVLWRFLRDLRSEKYDVALDFQGLFRSGFIARASGAPLRYGFAHAREGAVWFYNRLVKLAEMHCHAADKNLALVRRAFDVGAPLEPPDTGLLIPAEAEREAQRLLAELPGDGPLVAVCFSSRWPSKNWPLGFLADVLNALADQLPKVRCWLLGTAGDRTAGEQLASLASRAKPANLAGRTTLEALAALLRRSNAMLTVDSGPMHLAAALGVRCFALFGSTDPVLTGPYGSQHLLMVSHCPQSPCFERHCPRQADCSEGMDAAALARQMANHLTTENCP
ncbi:MAG: glycosyltransferase family 9 protein [Victivallales bacterium]|nr:glycosyltransferase family 9 protein [Victivallales bacterium]